MSEQQARELIKKYLSGTCTEAERLLVEQYFQVDARQRAFVPSKAGIEKADRRMMNILISHVKDGVQHPVRSLRRWLPYAAAVIITLAVGIWFFTGNRWSENGSRRLADITAVDIPPGGNRATLTLADGRTINLSEAQTGIVVEDENITYEDGNPLAVISSNPRAGGEREISPLELTTPKGGTYQITLPDGSKVWLNAASTLKYPSKFYDDERVVEISGEAYFSVVDDEHKPFKVVSNGQEIQVLGTEFNISAYPDDNETRTTLVNGVVQIVNLQSKIVNKIMPGQQATIRGAQTDVHHVDTEPYTAWKDGYFYFEKTPLEEILRQASRWYDVEIVYKRGIPKETFSGDIKRDVSLLGLLEILHLSTINVTLEGNTLIIL